MRRVYREGGYPCGECPEVFPTPAGLGGHRAWHRANGSSPARPVVPIVPPVTLFCECGGALTLRGESNLVAARLIEAAWTAAHDGSGHGPCSAADATLIRYSRTRAFGR